MAEVLITLGIIGVVAAFTLPSLITKYQKEVTVERLKKVYSTMNNAANLSVVDNGSMDTWEYPTSSYYDNGIITFFRKYYMPYLNGATECIDSNCFMKKKYTVSPDGLFYAGYIVTLADGTFLYFLGNINAGYFWMFADINGEKRPNIVGKDIFVFDIYKYNGGGYKVKFWNILLNTDDLKRAEAYGCNANSPRYKGFNCGALIQKSGWKIPDDYPW